MTIGQRREILSHPFLYFFTSLFSEDRSAMLLSLCVGISPWGGGSFDNVTLNGISTIWTFLAKPLDGDSLVLRCSEFIITNGITSPLRVAGGSMKRGAAASALRALATHPRWADEEGIQEERRVG